MFTKITLRNFRSFDYLVFDLSKRGTSAKNLAVVFGENGIGKSNLMSAFVLLNELLDTMRVRESYEEFLSQKAIFTDESLEKALRQQIISGIRDMQSIINDYRMVGCDEPLSVDYEFQIAGSTGTYSIMIGESEILHERLEYQLNQRKGVYFDCTREKIQINPGIVSNKGLLSDIKEAAKRFWGKHSILAIVMHEFDDKSKAYGQDSISPNFNRVFVEFSTLSCQVGIGRRSWSSLEAPTAVFENAIEGKINRSEEKQLDLAEKIFSQVFSAINSDYNSLYYQRDYTEKSVSYRLFVKKQIAGIIRDIDFRKESTGNHQIVNVICYLLSACFGTTVVMDEADSGIHDILFQKILQEALPHINGQVIIATHNTMLMQASFARESTYILKEEEDGSKTVKCVSNSEKRVYLNNNIRNKYLNNEYGGLPSVRPIDFEALVTLLQKG